MKRWGEHKSIWNRNPTPMMGEALRGHHEFDVVVVGAGITGLTAAYLLARAGRSVAVLTDGEIGQGTTSHSTGHLTQVLDVDFHQLLLDFGLETVRKVVSSVTSSIDLIEKLIAELKIDCGFERVPGFKFAESSSHKAKLIEEVGLAQELGIKCKFLDSNPLPFSISAVAKYENQAQFDPQRYLRGLAAGISIHGGFIFEESRVHKVEDGKTCQIFTADGTVEAKEVFLATHTPIGNFISLHTRIAPYFSYVLAVRLKNPPTPGLFWDMDNPYQYLRPFDRTSNLWLIGGRDHKTGQAHSTLEKYLELEDYVRLHFEVEKIEAYWGSEFYDSVDGLPYIGKIPFTSHLHTGTGYSGTGLTFGTLAGQILADNFIGTKNHWQNIYSPSRIKPLASAGTFIKENMNVARWMVSDLISREDMHQIRSLPPGEGRIIEIDNRKVAIYKDYRNGVHPLTPACTHMGGTVHWNSAEKTWDCPCHGGRYKPTGEVFAGPPLEDLAHIPFVPQIEQTDISAKAHLPKINPLFPIPDQMGI